MNDGLAVNVQSQTKGGKAELQWLHNPSKMNGDNMKNLKWETSRAFRTEEKGMFNRQNK